jgi:hypothetical protein
MGRPLPPALILSLCIAIGVVMAVVILANAH